MAFKLAHTDLTQLDGVSGKFEVSENYIVFKARNGSVSIIAMKVQERAKTVNPSLLVSTESHANALEFA